MQMKEILELERSSEGDIILHKEGIFWRAYQISAYLFATHIRELKVISKFIKVVKEEVAYLGFPHSILEEILREAAAGKWKVEQEERLIRIKTGVTVQKETWEAWLLLHKGSTEAVAQVHPDPDKPSSVHQLKKVIRKLRSYPILEKSPLETQQFVLELQKEINGFI